MKFSDLDLDLNIYLISNFRTSYYELDIRISRLPLGVRCHMEWRYNFFTLYFEHINRIIEPFKGYLTVKCRKPICQGV